MTTLFNSDLAQPTEYVQLIRVYDSFIHNNHKSTIEGIEDAFTISGNSNGDDVITSNSVEIDRVVEVDIVFGCGYHTPYKIETERVNAIVAKDGSVWITSLTCKLTCDH